MSNTLNTYGRRSQTSSPPSSKLPLSPIRRSSVASSTPTLPPVQEDDESLLSKKRRPLTAPSWYSVPLISNRTPTHFYHSPGVPASPPQNIGGMPQRGSGSSSSATPDLITHLRRSLPLPQYHRMSENGRSYPSIFVLPPSTSPPSLPPCSQLRYIEPERAISRPAVATTQAKSEVERSGRAAKMPPSSCGVCAVTATSEWRRGPAGVRSLCNPCGLVAARRARDRESKGLPQPNTIALIERELEAIGIERFKPVNGTYKLDAGARDRIHEAQRRTRAEQAMRKPTPSRSSPPSKQDKTAASNLVQFARRASASSAYSTARPSSRPRSSSLASSASSSTRSRHASNVTTELPPSSSYLRPPAASQPQSAIPRSVENSLRHLCHGVPTSSPRSGHPYYSSHEPSRQADPSTSAARPQKIDRMSILNLSIETPSPPPPIFVDPGPTKLNTQVEAFSFTPATSPGRVSSVRTMSN